MFSSLSSAFSLLRGWRIIALTATFLGLSSAYAAEDLSQPKMSSGQVTTVPATITRLSDLALIEGPQRDLPHPVRFIFDVDFFDWGWKSGVGRNEGISYYFRTGDTPLPLQVDQRYLVEGTLIPSEKLSLANLRFTRQTNPSPLPTINLIGQPFNPDDYTTFRPRARLEGYVQFQFSPVPGGHQCLLVLCGNNLFYYTILGEKADVPDYQDKFIRFEGLVRILRKIGSQPQKFEIYGQCSPPPEILGDLSGDPRFNIERTTAEQLPKLRQGKPIKVSGILHEQASGIFSVLRDETGLVKVRSPQVRNFKLGEPVEAVGIPTLEGSEFMLRDGFMRPGGPLLKHSASSNIRLADEVLRMNAPEAAKGFPVKITGVVTWSDLSENYLYVQDTSAGIRIDLGPKLKADFFIFGRFIEVIGKTSAGKFAPEIQAQTITVIDSTNDPIALPITYEQAVSGTETGQWVYMTGFLRAVTHDNNETQLHFATGSGEFIARLSRCYINMNEYIGGSLGVRGVCAVQTNEQGDAHGFCLLSTLDGYVKELVSPPADPFFAQQRTIAGLRKFNPARSQIERFRFVGQVVHHVPGRYLYVQDGGSGLLALSRSDAPLKPGDHVELVGLIGREGNRPLLRETIYRRIGENKTLKPTALPAQPINESLDGCLVQTSGRLFETSQHDQSTHFLIKNETASFEAILEQQPRQLPPAGAELRLTGVYQIEYDEYRHPRGFHLLLRSPADVTVLAQPSWWNAGRALYVVGVLLGCILLVVVWVNILRRRVVKQTELIRTQLQKEALLQARYGDIIENASDFIFTLDEQGRITSFNPAGERMTGLSRKQALTLTLNDLLAPEALSDTQTLLNLRSESEPAVTCQTRFKTADGRIIWVEICARAHHHPDRPYEILAAARDISARKHIEEELRRARDAAEATTRAKSAFLANMSHEIRTPMNGVIGMTNLLIDTPLNAEQRDFAETIRSSAESLLTVLNDILDFSKIEAGKLNIENIDFDLHETVESTLELLAARANEKHIELASFLPPSLPTWVRGDPGRLRQVLLNLIGNGLKFTEKGEVIINASLESETETDLCLRVEVSDTGLGLDEETQARLFQPFIQADGSTTRKFGGTGLGLAISKQIVQLMQGEIGVRSTPGHGATFWFTVRLEKISAAAPGKPPKISALLGLRTLIVDDNATNRKILEHYCAAWGLQSESCISGPEALTALRTAAAAGAPFQIVLTDYQMPEMDGLTLAREVLHDEKIVSTRIILLTSWDRRFSREELGSCGIVRMLVKPFRQQEVLGALLRCVRNGNDSRNASSTLPSDGSLPHNADSETPLLVKTPSLRVLIAEDNIVNQRVAALQLKNLGHVTEIAANGFEVLKALETKSYDVIFMDGQMPELDGYETTRRIRQNPAYAGLCIIAMTANAMQGDRERCLAVGMDDYVSKPTRPADLQAALERRKINVKI